MLIKENERSSNLGWDPIAGCFRKWAPTTSACVRITNRHCPLAQGFFKQVGDNFKVDEETVGVKNLQWARVLIKMKRRKVPGKLQVVVGQLPFFCLPMAGAST